MVGQLYDAERHLLILPKVAPASHHLLQIVGIGGRIACVRLALIPYYARDSVWRERMNHSVVECCRHVLQRYITSWALRHLGSHTHLPLVAERNHILRHRVLRHTVVAKTEHVRLLRDKVSSTVFVDKADGNHIIAFAEQSFRNIIASWGILIACMSDLLSVKIGDVLIEKRSKQQSGWLSRVFLIYNNMLPEPHTANTSPSPVVLVDGLPVCVLIVGLRIG